MKAPDVIRGMSMIAYAFLWVGGMVSYTLMGGPPEGTGWTAPLYLALAGAVVFAFTRVNDWAWLCVGAGIGFLSELSGVAFGVPYSDYQYTDVLGPKLLGVPLVLTTAWLILLAYVQHWTVALKLPVMARPVVAALWMTAIDLVIDPLAAGPLGYWRWESEGAYFGIPALNFVGWFVTSLLIFLAVPRSFRPHVATRALGASVIVFFGVIAFALGFLLPGVVALLLVGGDVAALAHARRVERKSVQLEAT